MYAIASRLCPNYNTVAHCQTAIRQKLGVETSAQLAKVASRSGLMGDNGERPVLR